MRLTTDKFAEWLQSRIDAEPYEQFALFYGRQPDNPDRCTTVFKMGSGIDIMDGQFEQIPFRLQTRGKTNSLADAEDLALFLDDIIYKAKNVMVSGIYVTEMFTTNKPIQMPMIDRQSRYQFLADYTVVASRFN